jgi:hypothetical protein
MLFPPIRMWCSPCGKRGMQIPHGCTIKILICIPNLVRGSFGVLEEFQLEVLVLGLQLTCMYNNVRL